MGEALPQFDARENSAPGELCLLKTGPRRLIQSWVGARAPVEAYRMAPADVIAARVWKRLPTRQAEAIRVDLTERKDAFLADTLRALLGKDRWVEQEVFLGSDV